MDSKVLGLFTLEFVFGMFHLVAVANRVSMFCTQAKAPQRNGNATFSNPSIHRASQPANAVAAAAARSVGVSITVE